MRKFPSNSAMRKAIEKIADMAPDTTITREELAAELYYEFDLSVSGLTSNSDCVRSGHRDFFHRYFVLLRSMIHDYCEDHEELEPFGLFYPDEFNLEQEETGAGPGIGVIKYVGEKAFAAMIEQRARAFMKLTQFTARVLEADGTLYLRASDRAKQFKRATEGLIIQVKGATMTLDGSAVALLAALPEVSELPHRSSARMNDAE